MKFHLCAPYVATMAKRSPKAKPAKPRASSAPKRAAKKAKSPAPKARTAKVPRKATGTKGSPGPQSGAGDWREATLARMRALILEADAEMVEERKWRKASNAMQGLPVWSHDGIVCTGETYSKVVKLTFARGASIPDPHRLFNSSLEGHTRRAIDIHEGKTIDAEAFKALVRAAVAANSMGKGA